MSEIRNDLTNSTWFAPAKLNLFLHIINKREDNYHNLQSVFQLIDLKDTIHIEINHKNNISLEKSFYDIEDDDNLIIKAAKLLKSKRHHHYGANISVEKTIPAGAGLGGGSSNAATTLIALNQLWQTNFSKLELMNMAQSLGADVPFFIFGHNAWVEGIGEKLSKIELAESYYLIIVSDQHCSTKELFANENLNKNVKKVNLVEYLNDVDSDKFHNVFQPVVYQLYPEIKKAAQILENIVEKYKNQSANESNKINIKMSGTGAAVFVKINATQKAQIQQEMVLIKKNLKKMSIFLIKSLSIHPHVVE